MKKNMMNTIARVTTIAMIAVALFVTFGTVGIQASEMTVGNNAGSAEYKAEAFAEKAMAVNNKTVATVEPVVEGATGTTNDVVVVETVIAETAEATEAQVEEEVVEEIVEGNVETAEEFVEADELEMEAEIASTATASATNNEVKTIDAATAAASADGVTVQFGTTATAAATTTVTTDVNAKYLGTPSGNKKAITLIGDSTFRDINKLQAAIDADNIVCYPTADMTKGVKYMAGHNPGAMSHVAGLKVGSIVRLSNDGTYQDYQIKEIKQGSGSFASITFNTTKGVMDAWTMLKGATENAVIIQYCIDGVNTLHYGVAL